MSLKYYSAYNATRTVNPKQSYKEDFTAIQELAFDNAPNVYYGSDEDCVEYEYIYGANVFKPIDMVRVDDVVEYNTGLYSSDDFKVFIFKNNFTEANKFTYGSKFRWKNNTWLVINSNILNGIANSVEVRRCNNVARFYDKWGNKIYEPCIMDITLRFTRNNTAQPIITSNGEQKLWLQRNDRTVHIKGNQRFLFGPKESRVAYKVYASGSKDYINTITGEDNSPSLTEIYMQFDQIDLQRDDIEEGFADARIAFYDIVGKDISGDYKIGDVIPLEFIIYRDKDKTDLLPDYTIDVPDIAEIKDNTLVINNNGKFTLTVMLKDNKEVRKDYVINVVENPKTDYQIRIMPNVSYILQGKKQVFECGLYSNGALISEKVDFTFKDNTLDVPSNKYSINVIDGQHFEIQNKGMFMKSPVKVLCTYKDISQEFDFELRGVY